MGSTMDKTGRENNWVNALIVSLSTRDAQKPIMEK
jgi:hypothetical protein